MMKISQFLPKGVGVLFPEKPYLKLNTPPLPVKKRNPGVVDEGLLLFFLVACHGTTITPRILGIRHVHLPSSAGRPPGVRPMKLSIFLVAWCSTMVALSRATSMEEHLVVAGAKNPAAAAAALAEEEIESFEDLLAIDDHLLLEALKTSGIKTGSATKIHAYCAQFRRRGGPTAATGASPPPAPPRGGGMGKAVASAVKECASNDLSAVENEIDELQAILDSSDQVGLSFVMASSSIIPKLLPK